MSEVDTARANLGLHGRDIAEIEIEAQRDAQHNNYDISRNPYPSSTYAGLIYTRECQRNHPFLGARLQRANAPLRAEPSAVANGCDEREQEQAREHQQRSPF